MSVDTRQVRYATSFPEPDPIKAFLRWYTIRDDRRAYYILSFLSAFLLLDQKAMLGLLAFCASALVPATLAQTILTGETQCISAGKYELCQNQWGASNGVGSQNSTYISSSGYEVSWSTNWTWSENQNDVKSYANVGSNVAKGMKLSAITAAPTSWNWTYAYQSSDIRADVSYDIWIGTTSNGAVASNASSYEVMIWLSGLGGIDPVGSQITTGTEIAGHSWNLWSGPNQNWHVYSFVSASGNINSFSADLNDFFTWLETNEDVDSSLYLQEIQAGTEAFTGAANLVISGYTATVST